MFQKKLRHALLYDKKLSENLTVYPKPELPKENPYYTYANSIRLENIAKNTKNETERDLTMYPVPPKYEKIYQQSPKTKFVKHGGTKKRHNRNLLKVIKRKKKTKRNNKKK